MARAHAPHPPTPPPPKSKDTHAPTRTNYANDTAPRVYTVNKNKPRNKRPEKDAQSKEFIVRRPVCSRVWSLPAPPEHHAAARHAPAADIEEARAGPLSACCSATRPIRRACRNGERGGGGGLAACETRITPRGRSCWTNCSPPPAAPAPAAARRPPARGRPPTYG